jgi:thiamine kinase-like enzyme
MQYLYNFTPLYKIFKNLDTNKIITKINKQLIYLHSFTKKYVTKEIYIYHLKIEIETKIMDRIRIINPIIQKYNYIKTINNKQIIPFEILMEKLKSSIYNIIDSKNEYYFVPIHGDCQFNNILYNNELDECIFIDPRGYFGELSIFGISEYDDAKVKFALSGYDEFDNRHIDNLNIKDNNIEIFIDFLDENIINDKSLSTLLMITIWLGNSHCFISNEYKAVYSYYIALYLGTLFFTQ